MGLEGLNRIKGILCIFAAGVFLSACGGETTGTVVEETPIFSMGVENPSFEYEEQKPHLIVSAGFATDEQKIVYADNSLSGQQFSVVDARNSEVIYTGEFYSLSDSEETACVGDFSEVTTKGDYWIWNKNCGYSSEFSVSDDAYEQFYESAYNRLEEMPCEDVVDKCYRMSYMMITSEIYEDSFIDWVYINQQRAELEKYIRANYLDFENNIIKQDKRDDAEKWVLAGTLAYYGSLYMDLDEEQAIKTIGKAEALYESCLDVTSNYDSRYFAISYLYRATGDVRYKSILDKTKEWESGDMSFLADMGYIMSVYPNNYNKCEVMLNGYLEQAKDIAIRHNTRVYFEEGTDFSSLDDELDELVLLGIADYALAGSEYVGVRRDYVRYIGGCNDKASDIITTSNGNTDNIKTMSKIIFVMGY